MKTLGLVLLILCQVSLQLVKADVTCYDDFTDNPKDCYDTGGMRAYCCELNSNDCCYYTNVWNVWYFWFGIIVFVSVFSACMAACCRSRRGQQQQTYTQNARVVTVTSQQQHYCVTGQTTTNPSFQEFPPSYENVQKTGISPEFQQYAKPYVIPGNFPTATQMTSPYPPTTTSYPHN